MTEGEYLEACRDARDALYDLVMATEPDTGSTLRIAYRGLKRMIAQREGQPDEDAPKSQRDRERQEWYERRNAWKQIPHERREALLCQLLGDEHLTIRELAERFESELRPDCLIYNEDIRPLVNRMFRAGQLDRVGEQWRSRTRYRYFVKRTLEGPIAELQDAFDASGDEGVGT